MSKKFFILFIFFSTIVSAQYSINGTIAPKENFKWILLYKLENGKQTFVDNVTVENGNFIFRLSEDQPIGIYRAYYQIENGLYVEFLYNKEEVNFTFNANNPTDSIRFLSSDENKIYQKYYQEISKKQNKLDSLQVAFFKLEELKSDKQITKEYKKALYDLQTTQNNFEKKSQAKLANHFITASAQYNAELPFNNPQEYLTNVKSHFFDNVDFSDVALKNSTFINDKLTDYVFYLNQSEDLETRNILHKKAIENAEQKIARDFDLRKSFEESLLQSYTSEENAEMVDFVMREYYNNLPSGLRDTALIFKIESAMKTAVGNKAPDFNWEENDISRSLYGTLGHDYYIVVFFGSDCSHCQIEMPEFYNFIKEINNVKVITIGLEEEKEGWEKMISNFKGFTNILVLDKWNDKKVRDYGVNSIPSFFILDSDKIILAKPYGVKELKAMFEPK